MFRNLLRGILRTIASLLYRVRVRGDLNSVTAHERTLIVANHESWLDGLLLGLFMPGNPVFVVYTGIVGRPFFRLALSLVDYLTVDPASPMAMKKVVELLKSGRPVVIFPEGRLTTRGERTLMKVYEGPAFAAVKSEATIIPVALDGPGRTPFTRLKGLHPRQWFPQITLSVQPPKTITVPEGLMARERRRLAGESMRAIMEEMLFRSTEIKTLYGSFLGAMNKYGRDRAIMLDVKQLESPLKTPAEFGFKEMLPKYLGLGLVLVPLASLIARRKLTYEDVVRFIFNTMRKEYTYADLLQMTVGLGRIVSKHTRPPETIYSPALSWSMGDISEGAVFVESPRYGRVLTVLSQFGVGRAISKYILGKPVRVERIPGETVGVFMPNMAATLGVLLGASAKGRVPAMLNYKAGVAGLLEGCTAAAIKTVIASRAFIEKGKLQAEEKAMLDAGIKLVYLEDERPKLTMGDKLAITWAKMFPRGFEVKTDVNSPAVVIFTSGSESKPKGVVLSHANIGSNIAQVRAVFDFGPEDRALNALPIFHAFGLTGALLLPLFNGISVLLYANPLHSRVIPELVYDRNITVLFGTNTFLANYANPRYSNNYDFARLDYVIAGAEKLRDEVRTLWFERFGKRIYEGWGASEASPVIAVNTPKACRSGTVGPMLPGIERVMVPVEGFARGGVMHIRGPNIMLGYYRFENPGVLEPTKSSQGIGWYDTGDLVDVQDGFVTILDRIKRLANIGGEKVSLTRVEQIMERAVPGMHAVTTRTDPNKGEVLVAFTTAKEVSRQAISEAARAEGASEMYVPRIIERIPEMPLLGTGKTNYIKLKEMAAALPLSGQNLRQPTPEERPVPSARPRELETVLDMSGFPNGY